MKKTIASLLLAVAALSLTACAAPPDREEVAERVIIELLSASGLPEDTRDNFEELGLDLADDMAKGYCGEYGYYAGLQDTNLIYAVRVTCLMYYREDLSEAQIADANAAILERAVADGK